MKLRDCSRRITDKDVAKAINWSEPKRTVAKKNMSGACACGRQIVTGFQYSEEGKYKHSRRRCTYGGEYTFNPKW